MFGEEVAKEGLKLGQSIFGVIDQLVDDGDLAAKLKNGILEKQIAFSTTVLTTSTTPKTDAAVKLLYAMRDVVIPMLRPFGSAAMSAFAAYAAVKGIQMDPATHAAMASAFPGWMVSRHIQKKTEANTEVERERVQAIAGSAPRPTSGNNFSSIMDNVN